MIAGYNSFFDIYYDYKQIIEIYLRAYLSFLEMKPVSNTSVSDQESEEFEIHNYFFLDQTEVNLINIFVEEIENRKKNTKIFLPFEYISNIFHLEFHEKLILMAVFWGNIDLRFGKTYEYINNNAYLSNLTLGTVWTMFCQKRPDIFLKMKSEFLSIFFDYEPDEPDINKISLILKKRIFNLFMGDKIIKDFMFGKVFNTLDELPKMYGRDYELNMIIHTVKSKLDVDIIIEGNIGTGRKLIVKHACRSSGKNVFFADWKILKNLSENIAVNELKRELKIQKSLLCLINIESKSDFEDAQLITDKIRSESPEIFIISDEPVNYNENNTVYHIKLKELDFNSYERLWNSFSYLFDESVNTGELAGKYKFNPGQIIKIIKVCENECHLNKKNSIDTEMIERICINSSENIMGNKAVRIKTIFTLDDLILPDEEKQQIKEGMDHIKYKHIVYDKWDFKSKIGYGRGLSMLFEGPTGTGKTMAASIIGNELGIPVFKIDISKMFSKFIGETEKNLGEVFDIANNNNAILFFDETDALFGKRSEIKDSHDKHANIETSYLLQKMEEYDGITIMTTNFLENIDEAFLRRISYIIHFPFPEYEQRLAMWKTVFPIESNLGKNIDFEFLAEKFELSGAMIKNSAVSAAFLAVGTGGEITMVDILKAIKKQFLKYGKNIKPHELGSYAIYFK